MVAMLARRALSGDVYLNLAKIHLDRHEWGEALVALQRGMEKGNLSNPVYARKLFVRVNEALRE